MPVALLRKIKSRLRPLKQVFFKKKKRKEPAESAVVSFPVRELIYSFRFDEAELLIDKLSISEKIKSSSAQRLKDAIAFNRSSELIGRMEIEAESLPGDEAKDVGSWSVRWIDGNRLMIRGTVDADCPRVALFVNNRVIRLINSEPSQGEPGQKVFRYNLKKDVIARFPRKATLAVGSECGFLRYRGGRLVYRHASLAGDNTLFEKLQDRYFINKKGRLSLTLDQNEEWKEEILDAYAKFREYFESKFNYKPYFICGTLLGYRREGDFIPHDDDLDVSFLSRQRTPEGVKEELKEIVFQMLLDGFDIKLARRPGFFKPKINGLMFDVTPMWLDRGELWMLNATHLRAGTEIIEPVQLGEFRGRDVYVPNDPDRVLELEYGPGWRVPDPGYRTIFDPEDNEYLVRSCLAPEEIRELYAKIEEVRTRNPGVGRLSLAGRKSRSILDESTGTTA